MSKGLTDFNDQFISHGKTNLERQLEHDLIALQAVMQKEQVVPDEGPPTHDETLSCAERDIHPDVWVGLFELNQYGKPKASVRNVELVLNNAPGWVGVLGFCEFSYRIMKRKAPPLGSDDVGEWNDADAAALRVWMSYEYKFTPSHADIADALSVTARRYSFHPVREYLNSLKWDGVQRLDTWLQQAFESTDDEKYLKIVGPKILIGAVARVMQPGCKMDNVMIFEGEQGKGKSTAIRELFGEFFTDAPLPIGDKDAYMVIQGKWGFELAELDSFNKSEVTSLKHFFSQQIDRFRPAYGRVAQDHPRQTVFMGSTNQDAYLRDYTGNRRFWPLYCRIANAQWIKIHRDQLWAEALYLYNQGQKWWVSQETAEDEAEYAIVTEAQNARLQRDPWEDILQQYLLGRESQAFSAAQILMDALKFDAAHIQQAHMNRIGPILRVLGWKSKRERVADGDNKFRQVRLWRYVGDKNEWNEVPLDD